MGSSKKYMKDGNQSMKGKTARVQKMEVEERGR